MVNARLIISRREDNAAIRDCKMFMTKYGIGDFTPLHNQKYLNTLGNRKSENQNLYPIPHSTQSAEPECAFKARPPKKVGEK